MTQDLTDNLVRIRSHGDRANRIVHDMLSMGRGSGDRSPTDINQLVDEYTRLAYHSARGTDQNFQLSIERDFDDAVGELNVVSQDLGRVFLNMVANSCYATDERRQASTTDDSGMPFMPVVGISEPAAHNEDQRGTHLGQRRRRALARTSVEQMFNLLFTTPPSPRAQGQGHRPYGWPVCSDIVRPARAAKHRVEVEEGTGTEMIIDCPLVPPSDQPSRKDADSLLFALGVRPAVVSARRFRRPIRSAAGRWPGPLRLLHRFR